MNIDKIKAIVAKTEGLFGWTLRRTETDATTVIRLPGIYTTENGRFVRHANSHPREVINAPGEEVWVTVYCRHTHDGVEQMGEAQGQFVSDDEAAVKATLAGLIAAALSQPNKPYPLVDKTAVYPNVELADPKLIDASRTELLARVQQFSDAMLRATAAESGVDVSNLEVFIRRSHSRVETGAGIRVEFPATRADVEICFIARFEDKVAEHTARRHARRFEDLNPEDIARTNAGYARAIAQAGPPSQYQGPIVLSGEAAANFMGLDQEPLSFHCSARAVHEKISRYEKGRPVWGEGPLQGDALTFFSDPLVPFGISSRIETDATPCRRIALVEEGRYAELYGTSRYYHYLGLLEQGVKPTGLPGNTVVPAGKTSTHDLLGSGRVVVIKAFSDFHADPTGGDFSSEIRLGEVTQNGTAVPFRGGLLIGNWFDALADVRFSSETMALDGYYGPSAVRVGNLQVTG